MSGFAGRYMTPNQAQVQGFGSLFTIAENYTRFAILFPDQAFDFVDAVKSPFPKSHDGGTLHHVWISGCKHALSVIDSSATDMTQKRKQFFEKALERITFEPDQTGG